MAYLTDVTTRSSTDIPTAMTYCPGFVPRNQKPGPWPGNTALMSFVNVLATENGTLERASKHDERVWVEAELKDLGVRTTLLP
ncbi:hypothetical protein [Rhizobium leguminosarum]|uniref:hypothetical protein n=1 Tax=Rhizobium leguminosarum TaxID=384 RepID=UPI001AA0A66C|nr:hypothetical protein [Rhizobium leguminosarum]